MVYIYLLHLNIYISQYILLTFSLVHNKNKLNKTLVFSSRDIPNFNILKERLGILFPPHFLHDFWRIAFLLLYFINWWSFNVWLPLLCANLENFISTYFKKNTPKIPISDTNKGGLFFKFCLYSNGHRFSITRFDVLLICNILHLEMNFRNLY